jgi:molecular chaperone GrpE
MSENEERNTEENGKITENEGPSDLKADLEKAKNDYLYLLADFDNFRKNSIKERSDLIKFGTERLVRELLGVVDNFERALESEASSDKFREGISLINQELKSLLNRNGVQELPCDGLRFDPSSHEALSSEPTDRVPEGHVARVFKKAYKLHDKLVRPAQVVVATAPKNDSQ